MTQLNSFRVSFLNLLVSESIPLPRRCGSVAWKGIPFVQRLAAEKLGAVSRAAVKRKKGSVCSLWSRRCPEYCAKGALGNVDGALYLLFLGFGQLWHGDGEHAVVHFGGNVFFHHIVGQGVGLLVIGVAELAVQVVLLFVLIFVQ